MLVLKKLTDQELAENYLNGDEKSLNELVIRHQSGLINYIHFIVKDRDLANDIFQETFFKFIRTIKAGAYKNDGRFYNFVKTIAHNLAMDHLRSQKKLPTISGNENWNIFDTLKLTQSNVLDSMMKKQTLEMVIKVFEKLPAKHQDILNLRFKENMSFKEIAQMKKLSINTCLGQYRYAVKHIQGLVSKYQLTDSF